MEKRKSYIAIDLKSFYASVECIERNLDPLNTNLVVADVSRTQKTICLAVSPTLKAYGIAGRARLFEVVQRVKQVNAGKDSTGSSYIDSELKASPELLVDYITAPPRMALYMEYSTRIYQVYLKYIAPEDIHVYSIDEVFIDVTGYLKTYDLSAHDLAKRILRDVLQTTGITATAGIGTNLYLCKIAMDIVAKNILEDEDGVRIAELDEMSYRHILWSHRPLTDFWRVGRGYAKKLEKHGLMTMGDIARCSIGKSSDFYNEDLLYSLFGINAELLIDHAWGWEPCTMADVKAYKPSTNSMGSGQVLQCPYTCDKARLIVHEMTDLLVLDLVDQGLVTDQMVLTVGYDIEQRNYNGPVTTDSYGRQIPKHAHGTTNLPAKTSSSQKIIQSVLHLFDKIVDETLMVRRINITANHVIKKADAAEKASYEQMSLFDMEEEDKEQMEKEEKVQHAILEIKKKYGKNALLKGMNFKEGAMTIKRNGQIGGHKA